MIFRWTSSVLLLSLTLMSSRADVVPTPVPNNGDIKALFKESAVVLRARLVDQSDVYPPSQEL